MPSSLLDGAIYHWQPGCQRDATEGGDEEKGIQHSIQKSFSSANVNIQEQVIRMIEMRGLYSSELDLE